MKPVQHSPVVVTVSRQLGSGGSYIAQQVAKRLDFKYLDREILRKAALRLGQTEETLSTREEKCSSLWERLISVFSPGAPEAPYVPPPLPLLDDRALFETEGEIIKGLSVKHDAVIVGRGAVHILKERPHAAAVYVHARKGFRVKRVMEIYHISDLEEARSLIEQSDRQRADFIRTMTGAVWSDARNYHLCLDTGTVGFDLATEMVLRLVQQVRGGKDTPD
jgi:cytidylate kinase